MNINHSKNLISSRVKYLEDGSMGTVISSNWERDSHTILFDDGVESDQPRHKFEVVEFKSSSIASDEYTFSKHMLFDDGVESDQPRHKFEVVEFKSTSIASDEYTFSKPMKIFPNIRKFDFDNTFPALYHITSSNNVNSIIKNGLLSHNIAHGLSLVSSDISMNEVQKLRVRSEPIYKRSIHSYVPLYLNPKNPMLFSRRENQNQIVVLKIDKSVLINRQHIFCDGNCASVETKFDITSKVLEGSIDVLLAPYWNDYYDGKRRRCSEILIYPDIPCNYIIEMVTCNFELYLELKKMYPVPVHFDSDKEFFFGC